MNKVLEQLLEKKGILSRKIGAAKRAGEPMDALLAEMQAISAQLKAIKDDGTLKSQPAINEPIEDTRTPALFDAVRFAPSAADDTVVIKPLTDAHRAEEWDRYVLSKAHSAIYHRWAFRDIIQSAFGHNAVYLAAFNRAHEICGVLPAIEMKSRLFGHFIVSLPFFTYGAALANSVKIECALYSALFDYAKQQHIEHVELRLTQHLPELKEAACKSHKVSMVRALPDSVEQLWADIGTKVRAQIKKAQRYPLTMKFGKAELLSDFYTVFSINMRDLGTPVYAKRFFKDLIESSLQQQFDLGVVYHSGKPVACCFLMKHKQMVEIPWASTVQSANDMNVNMFMYWEVLKKAVQEEQEFFDFGRSSKDAGTYQFKKQWGAKAYPLYWYYWLPEGTELPELNPNNPKYKLLISIWKRLPLWLSQLIGPAVVKYLP